jgi:hypothetical protein
MTGSPATAAQTPNPVLQVTLVDQSVTLRSAANRRSGEESNQ